VSLKRPLLAAATPAFSGLDAVAYQRDKLAELTAMLSDRRSP
jgi:hypothetical protein